MIGGAAAGILAIALAAIWLFHNRQPNPSDWSWVAPLALVTFAVVAFPVATIWAWVNQHEELLTMHEALQKERDASQPRLVGNIRILGKMPKRRFLVCMELSNGGATSVAKDYMPVVTVGGREFYGTILEVEDGIRVTAPDGSQRLILEKDAIYRSTRSPIARGDVRSGCLLAEFPEETGDFDKMLIRVRFRDYRGTVYETEPNEDESPISSLPRLDMLPFERKPD